MVKELTNKGIKEENLDLPKKESQRIEIKKSEKKDIFKKKLDEEQENKQRVSSYEPKKKMKKLTKILIISGISLVFLILIANMVWFNFSVQGDKLKDSSTINNNMPAITVPVGVNATSTNQYNITIENKIYLAENMSKEIANEILGVIKNCSSMNWTNCSI